MEQNNENRVTAEELMNNANAEFVKLAKDGKIMDVIDTVIKLDRKVLNALTIAAQNPDATDLKTSDGWNFKGRSVMPGEKSIKVIDTKYNTIENEEIVDGKVVKSVKSGDRTFIVNSEFDISQTKVKTQEFADKYDQSIDHATAAKNLSEAQKALEGVLDNYKFSYTPLDGVNGACNTDQRVITINSNLVGKELLAALIEKIGQALNNIVDRGNNFRGIVSSEDRNIRNIENQLVAYMVGKKLGLDVAAPDLSKVQEWHESKINKLRSNIDTAVGNASKITTAFGTHFEKLREATPQNDTKQKKDEQVM